MKTIAVALAATVSLVAAQAHAATQNFEFKGSTSHGVFDAFATLDVLNGFAVSGSGTITGAGLGTQSFQLVTSSADGAIHDADGNFGLQSNQGDNLDEYDDAVPVTATGGILFALGDATPAKGSSLLFGFFKSGADYGNQFYGVSDNVSYYETNNNGTTVSQLAVSAAPEPETWALMLAGVGVMGAALRLTGSRRRKPEAQNAGV